MLCCVRGNEGTDQWPVWWLSLPASLSPSLSLSLVMFTSALAVSLLIIVTKATALWNFNNLYPGIINLRHLRHVLRHLTGLVWYFCWKSAIIWQADLGRASSLAGMSGGSERDSSSMIVSMAGWLPGKLITSSLTLNLEWFENVFFAEKPRSFAKKT